MPLTHVVRAGDCLTSIAWQYGFDDFRVVYEHASNAGFRKRRPDPNIIHPGDEVVIPDLVETGATTLVPTGAVHRFRTKPPTRQLKLVIEDDGGDPLAGVEYRLAAGKRLLSRPGARTDATGRIELDIPLWANTLTLSIQGMTRVLTVGDLNPLRDTSDAGVSGVQARLKNLGFDPGPVDGVLGPRTSAAILAFREASGLETQGDIDDALINSLERLHRS